MDAKKKCFDQSLYRLTKHTYVENWIITRNNQCDTNNERQPNFGKRKYKKKVEENLVVENQTKIKEVKKKLYAAYVHILLYPRKLSLLCDYYW